MITGSLVAIVTPMLEDGRLDIARFKSLIDWHVAEGTDGIVVVGTSGESPTVDFDEHKELIHVAVAHAAGRVPVIAGTGANSTAEAIELTESAKRAGAAACLSVVPYYNRPTQEGLYRHFRTIAESVDIPNILYNVPGRTVADMSNETVLRLAQVRNIVGLKDATANIERGSDLLKRVPKGFALYSGDDATCLALMLLGGQGVISVTANVAPRLMHDMCAAALGGDLVRARALNFRLLGLHRRAVRRGEPDPGEMGGRRARPDRRRDPAAAHAALGRTARNRQGGDARGRRAAGERPPPRRGGRGMRQPTRTLVVVLAVPALVAGCSFGELFDSQKVDYKSASKLPTLEVPPDLTRPGRDDRYAMPESNPSGTATFSQYNAERQGVQSSASSAVLPTSDKIRVVRDGTQRYLIVGEAPDKLWPVVRDFWQENGFLLVVDVPDAGVMETDWAENRAKLPQDGIRNALGKLLDQVYSTGERDKFRTRLERSQDGEEHRDLHQPPRHGRAADGPQRPVRQLAVAAASAGSRARSGISQQVDGEAGQPGAERARPGRCAGRRPRGAREAGDGRRAARRRSTSTNRSIAPGAASASRSTASASRSRTATVRRASTSCATSIRRTTAARSRVADSSRSSRSGARASRRRPSSTAWSSSRAEARARCRCSTRTARPTRAARPSGSSRCSTIS